MKSIHFPSPVAGDMVRAILEGRKTVTRQVVRGYALDHLELDTDGSIIGVYNQDEGHVVPIMDYASYRPGDILYVSETWKCSPDSQLWADNEYRVIFKDLEMVRFYFKDQERLEKWQKYIYKPHDNWQSPYFMPREAARIFLRVTDVRVERLQEISDDDVLAEGTPNSGSARANRGYFSDNLWDSTIKPADRALYGWAANPWVWVIEFERCEKSEEDRT